MTFCDSHRLRVGLMSNTTRAIPRLRRSSSGVAVSGCYETRYFRRLEAHVVTQPNRRKVPQSRLFSHPGLWNIEHLGNLGRAEKRAFICSRLRTDASLAEQDREKRALEML
jgi:hypothetical protein